MATQTHQRRSVVTQSRPHDHLYDPIYSASGTHNPYPQMSQRAIPSWNVTSDLASTQAAQTIRFSALHSAADATAQRTANRQQKSQTRALYKQEQQYQQEMVQQQVLGRDRTKYIKRPVVPYLEPVIPGLLTQPNMMDDVINQQHEPVQEEEITLTRTIGIQTDYRESETQTDPYTADYITSPDDPEPELLALSHLTYGAGLPASLDEITLIQRMREKRAFEASLPPISDAASFELRKKLLEERELQEWSLREKEMKQEQEDRLQILIQTLMEREKMSEELGEARIDKIRQSKLAERDDTFDIIHRDRIKQNRALLREKDEREEKIQSTMVEHQLHKATHRRDIIAEYGDHASQVYAPIAREGKLPVKNQVVDYGIPLLSNFQGLSELERSLPSHLRDITISAPTKIIPVSLSTRKGQQIAADLEYVDKLLDKKKLDKPAVIENVYKKFEPLQRASTPSVTAPAHDNESVAALLLQRLIRGRAIQNMMYEGKQHHIHLIRELRLNEYQQEQKPVDQQQHDTHVALDTLQGELISNALDFVSKEIVRVNEEQKILSLVTEANFIRKYREAEESGKRQAEEIMQVKQQQLFEMTMSDHQATADHFLSDLLSTSITAYSHQHASADTSIHTQHITPLITNIESKQASAKQIVNELVANFVLPEVERRREKRQEDLSSHRFIDQAHQSVLYAVQQTLLRYQEKLLTKGTTTATPSTTTATTT